MSKEPLRKICFFLIKLLRAIQDFEIIKSRPRLAQGLEVRGTENHILIDNTPKRYIDSSHFRNNTVSVGIHVFSAKMCCCLW